MAETQGLGAVTMNVGIRDYEDYLFDHYKDHGIDTSLFMKLVEEIGEVADVLNQKAGRNNSCRRNVSPNRRSRI